MLKQILKILFKYLYYFLLLKMGNTCCVKSQKLSSVVPMPTIKTKSIKNSKNSNDLLSIKVFKNNNKSFII
jgi:hypothetical protein